MASGTTHRHMGPTEQLDAAAYTRRNLTFVVLALLFGQMVLHRAMEAWGNSKLNQNPDVPDAQQRGPYDHYKYILNKHDFVEVYSRGEVVQQTGAIGEDAWLASHKAEVFDMRRGRVGVTRCSTSQYAVITYFCGQTVADTDGELYWWGPQEWRTLVHAISLKATKSNGTRPQPVFRVHVTQPSDASLGHTFVVHFLPDGRAQVYQSFIGHTACRITSRTMAPWTSSSLGTSWTTCRPWKRQRTGRRK